MNGGIGGSILTSLFNRIASFVSRRILYSGPYSIECPICHFVGRFKPFGLVPRSNAVCPKCGSLERHRLLCLALHERPLLSEADRVLHFAPEPCLSGIIRDKSASYQSADCKPQPGSIPLNIENIALPSSSVNVVIANHVLEHVDDEAALEEIKRILTPGGRLIAMVPIVEAWEHTYEDPQITQKPDRERHFAQSDHVRFYGRDFRERICSHGFDLEEFQADGPRSAQYGLNRGECVVIACKTERSGSGERDPQSMAHFALTAR